MPINFIAEPVLIVEDELLVLESLADAMSSNGFVVIAANNGDVVAEFLERRAISVLVTDINLPGKSDGLAIAKLAREKNPALPIVFASAWVGDENTLESIHRTFDPPIATVLKPFKPSAIPGLVRRLLFEKAMWDIP